ncbi:hypothetical protein Tco_0532339 [Tanacetum coccineum]
MVQGMEDERMGIGSREGPTIPAPLAQTNTCRTVIKEKIKALQTLTGEHDQHDKIGENPKKLTCNESKIEENKEEPKQDTFHVEVLKKCIGEERHFQILLGDGPLMELPKVTCDTKVNMDDPNMTMQEYIRLEEEKARRRGKVFNWETTKYGKIWYDEDGHDLRSVETEFPAIVFNNNTSNETYFFKPTVSSINNEIDFRISFDESDDEDYTVIFDKNSFSYKIIYVNDLKTDSENDNEKVNMPSFSSPEPTVSCFDDLDFFKDFENEFPAIVYNDALTSKSDFLTGPTVNPQHIDEFNLKDETSLSECDEEEQNVLYFNDYKTYCQHDGCCKLLVL